MAILRPYFTPYLQPNPVQLLQNLQGMPQQQNAYQNYFQPQPVDPNQQSQQSQQSQQGQQEFEQPSFNTQQSVQDQYSRVQQSRQNQFQPSPLANNPVAATQTNPVTNFLQTSAARPNFQQYYNQMNTISGTGQDATDAAQQQALARQQQVLASINSIGGGSNASQTASGGINSSRVDFAKSLIGVDYVWGHQDKNGTDCSGLIYQVLNGTGTKVPRVTAAEYGRMGQAVSLAQARPGDVVYYDEPGSTDHVGIYVGNGQMIDAPYTGAKVRIDKIGNPTSIRRIGSPQGQGGNVIGAGAGAGVLAAKPWQSNQKLGQQLLAQAGLGNEWNSFNQLAMHESGWNNTAQNPSSTAYGIGQFLNSTWGAGGKTSDPRSQITSMLNYIKGHYGDPNNAWKFWQQHHWY